MVVYSAIEFACLPIAQTKYSIVVQTRHIRPAKPMFALLHCNKSELETHYLVFGLYIYLPFVCFSRADIPVYFTPLLAGRP